MQIVSTGTIYIPSSCNDIKRIRVDGNKEFTEKNILLSNIAITDRICVCTLRPVRNFGTSVNIRWFCRNVNTDYDIINQNA